ncbi:hypothetical protein SEVIR_4G067750v4 [Setaria viridis]
MKGSYSGMLYKMMAIFLSFVILLSVSPAQSRLYQLGEAQSIVTNTSANTTMVYSKAVENKTCDLVFCTKRSGCINENNGATEDRYCCEPDPKMKFCYGTRVACRAHCPFCKT